MISNAAERFDAAGDLTDDNVKKRIQDLLQSLVAWTRRLQKGSK